ncbi:MAG: zinc ABC transporter substrate-binding protein [Candidatus Zixiibacteriota bacterium]|nr:MAG: zinc ABC transporter substrate-binding protein [candidate division Zixibacteria bacterium]
MTREQAGRFRRLPAAIVCTASLLAGALASHAAGIDCFASIPPQAYFVEQVGGSLVNVEILVAAGQSPATYEPTPQQLTRLANADVLFTTGVPFESRLLRKIAADFQTLKIVATQAGITLKAIDRHHSEGHAHEEIFDPHVWLDPALAEIQAANICAALIEIDPSNRPVFERNLDDFTRRLDSVDTVVRQMLAPVRGRAIYVFHPAYGYFCDAYGLVQAAIEAGGKEPSARQLAELVERAERDSVSVIFIQPQFSQRQAESVGRAIGAGVQTLDPLSGDYLNNLVDMATSIASALGVPPAGGEAKR